MVNLNTFCDVIADNTNRIWILLRKIIDQNYARMYIERHNALSNYIWSFIQNFKLSLLRFHISSVYFECQSEPFFCVHVLKPDLKTDKSKQMTTSHDCVLKGYFTNQYCARFETHSYITKTDGYDRIDVKAIGAWNLSRRYGVKVCGEGAWLE